MAHLTARAGQWTSWMPCGACLAAAVLAFAACAVGGGGSKTAFEPIAIPDASAARDAAQEQSADAQSTAGARDGGITPARDAGPWCGDGTCNAGETCKTCRVDCGACAPPCGDGMCNGSDNCSNCPSDCGTCPARCGDGMCNGSDTCGNCTDECGACPPPCGELRAEQRLQHGESIASCDARFVLRMQADGNLVLYQDTRALWSSDTDGKGGLSAVMQSDGNFVVYDATRGIWSSNTSGKPGAWLALQTDGNLVVYSDTGVALWDSGTKQ